MLHSQKQQNPYVSKKIFESLKGIDLFKLIEQKYIIKDS